MVAARQKTLLLAYYVGRNTLGTMIQSFCCKHTRLLFEGRDPRRFRAFKNIAIRKLTQLEAAQTLEFLRSPPGNQLEALKGDRKGQHSIRINAQFRLCFIWTENGPTDVEIVDYH